MYIDSHCHLNSEGLQERIPEILQAMHENQVDLALCANVNLYEADDLLALVQAYPQLYCSVGVHPEYDETLEPTLERLHAYVQHPKVVAIGECGLDYYYHAGPYDHQHRRFVTQIEAAKTFDLPLIVHTRQARQDTLRLLREHGPVRGVLHCFTEDIDMARQALDLGFMISFSGIVTFKKATELQEVARFVPLDSMLIETDSPYLAPVPFRGKMNDPSKVIYVAQQIATLKNIPVDTVAWQTSQNFYRLFNKIKHEEVT